MIENWRVGGQKGIGEKAVHGELFEIIAFVL